MLQLDLFGLGNQLQPVKVEQEEKAMGGIAAMAVEPVVQETRKSPFEQPSLFDVFAAAESHAPTPQPITQPQPETVNETIFPAQETPATTPVAETALQQPEAIPTVLQQEETPAVTDAAPEQQDAATEANTTGNFVPNNTVIFSDNKISVKIKWKRPAVEAVPEQPVAAVEATPAPAIEVQEEASPASIAVETHLLKVPAVIETADEATPEIIPVITETVPEITGAAPAVSEAAEVITAVQEEEPVSTNVLLAEALAEAELQSLEAAGAPAIEATATPVEATPAVIAEDGTATAVEEETPITETIDIAPVAQQPWMEEDGGNAGLVEPASADSWHWQPAAPVAKVHPVTPAYNTAPLSKSKKQSRKKAEQPEAPAQTDARPADIMPAPAEAGKKRGRKSFREIDAEVDMVNIPNDDELYEKQYYPISTVAGWFNVNTSLLRYWENEFDILRPRKNKKGDRLFRPEDIKNLQVIYHLLRQRKFTIEGAKEYLKGNKKKADTHTQLVYSLTKLRSFLLEMKSNLQA
ncbi:MerR family transcriptional regulator [Deminuibacter soli]|nr:MerR family transcriptional regulator [Deminuibacter soli]